MSKILFLTTAHNYNDDRIFFHQAQELLTKGFDVKICSLYSEFEGVIDGIEIESFNLLKGSSAVKITKLYEFCNSYEPDCIICSEPITVIAAGKYRKKKSVSIVYDITEWYPSMSMLQDYNVLLKFIQGIKFLVIQLFAGFLSTHFIFGEETKKFPLAYFFPFKEKLILPYYPDEKFIHENRKELTENEITLCYTGAISKDKGVGNFFEAIDRLQKRNSDLKINILIVGSPRTKSDDLYFSNLLSQYSFDNIAIRKPSSFEKFTDTFADADICFDLREFNFENHHSLPIKLFYYMGAGKPVIYSDLKGIRKHLDSFDFGFLVNPQSSEAIAEHIEKYLKSPELYQRHAENAVKEFQEKYSWKIIKKSFVNFIQNSLPKTAR